MKKLSIAFSVMLTIAILLAAAYAGLAQGKSDPQSAPPPKAPFTDYRYEKPGTVTRSRPRTCRRLMRPNRLQIGQNSSIARQTFSRGSGRLQGPTLCPHPSEPRKIITAPNGDFFVAGMKAGEIKVFRGITADGKPQQTATFATGLNEPYGLAFYPSGSDPKYLYVGDTDAVIRFAYHNGDLKALSKPEHIADLPHGEGHSTRDLVFSRTAGFFGWAWAQ